MNEEPATKYVAVEESQVNKNPYLAYFVFYILSFFILYCLFSLGYLYEYYFPFSFFSLLFSNINLTVSVGNDWILFAALSSTFSLIALLPLIIRRLLYFNHMVLLVLLFLAYFLSKTWEIKRNFVVKTLDPLALNNLFSEFIQDNHILLLLLSALGIYGITILLYFVSKNFTKNKYLLGILVFLVLITIGTSVFLTLRLKKISDLSLFAVSQNKLTYNKCTELKPMLKDSPKWRKFYLQTCGPVWLIKELKVEQPSNVLLYELEFTGKPKSDGIFTIALGDKEIIRFKKSERENGNKKEITYFSKIEPGTYNLMFRLEPITFIPSVMVVKNVCIGYDEAKYCQTHECPCSKQF